MTREQAITDYFSKIVGTLIGELSINKVLTDEKARELINIIGDGAKEITDGYKVEKSILDSEVQT